MRILSRKGCFDKFVSLLDFYYSRCEGSIMPLFLLYLASEGNLEIADKARKICHTDDEKRFKGITYAQFSREDAEELSKTDPAGRYLIDKWECSGNNYLSLLMHYDQDDATLQEIRTIFQMHDEQLGDSMEKRRALFLLAQGLINVNPEHLRNDYSKLVSYIIKKSGIYPTAEDYPISCLEAALIGPGKWKAYYPFARIPFAAGLLPESDFTVEFTGTGKELASAAATLLTRRLSRKEGACKVCDKPLDSFDQDAEYDVVLSNRISRSDETHGSEPTLHFVLKKTMGQLSENGRFFGLDEMAFFFNSTCSREAFRKVVDAGKLARLILLPREYDAVLVEVRNGRTAEDPVELVDLFNRPLPARLNTGKTVEYLIEANTKKVSVADIQSHRYRLGEFFRFEVGEAPEGMKKFTLRNLLQRLEKYSSNLGVINDCQETLSEVVLNDGEPYNPFEYDAQSHRCDDLGVYEPAYFLTQDTLIIKDKGSLEPKIYRAGSSGSAFCREGLAFSFKPNVFPQYIINELMKPYMTGQLDDWSNALDGRHSADNILSLQIFCPVDNYGNLDEEKQKDICGNELDKSKLPAGFEIQSNESGCVYTILEKLGNGSFGISYKTRRSEQWEGAEDGAVVTLKEFFVRFKNMSERGTDHITKHKIGSIQQIKDGSDVAAERLRFIQEAEIMQRFGNYEDSHVRRVIEIFTCLDTNNIYYAADYYDNGTLSDVMKKGPVSEKETIEKYIIPLAKALNILHANRCVHLDLKPDNVLIDDEGLAVLTDFGISKLYGEDGKEQTHGSQPSSSAYAPEEECNVNVRMYFHPEMDIFALGAIYYQLITGNNPREYYWNGFDYCPKISEGSRKAIAGAMEEDYERRTSNVMDFVHALPGCEDLEFSIIEKKPDPVPDEAEASDYWS